jgi:hypothetical protein
MPGIHIVTTVPPLGPGDGKLVATKTEAQLRNAEIDVIEVAPSGEDLGRTELIVFASRISLEAMTIFVVGNLTELGYTVQTAQIAHA